MGSLRSAAYRATADSQAHGSRVAGAESRSAQLQAEVLRASHAHPCGPCWICLCPLDTLPHSCSLRLPLEVHTPCDLRQPIQRPQLMPSLKLPAVVVLQLSQLKQHSAVAEAEVQHICSTSATLQQRQQPMAHVGTTTDAAACAVEDEATASTGSKLQAEGSAAAADPGHLAPISSGGSPGAEVAVPSAAHDHCAAPDGPEGEGSGAEVVALRQRLQEAESQATALRAQLRQLRSDHEATCAELEDARGVVRELRESVRHVSSDVLLAGALHSYRLPEQSMLRRCICFKAEQHRLWYVNL